MAIKKHKETGKLVYDYIEFKGGSRSKITIKIIEENAEFPEGFNENTIYSVNRVNKYFWYVDGNKIIVDPPRVGLDNHTIDVLNEVAVDRLIYVSCDVMTLVRDLKKLDKYEVKDVTLVDMFSQTHHVETIVLLCRK